MEKPGILTRIKAACNALSGRYSQLDKDGFPIFGRPCASGVFIDAERALYATTVFACVNLLASVIASIPLKIYKVEPDGDLIPATEHPLYNLFMYKPNEFQTPYDFKLYGVECILLRGGMVSWINQSSNGDPLSIIPLHPDTVIRELDDFGRVLFSGLAQWGPGKFMRFEKMDSSQFLWCNYRTLDGLNPVSPVRYSAEAIGLAITAEERGATTLKNDSTPPLVVSFANAMKEEQLKMNATFWKEAGSGKNYGMPRFVDNGAKIERLSMSNEDAQYIETRRMQKEELCGIFRVPPSMIGDTQRAQGWSTLEQKNSDFLTYTLMPYLVNIEEAISRAFIPPKFWGRIVPMFQTKALTKADIAARTQYYQALHRMGAISPNEIRHEEGYNSRPGGDEYVRESAMVVDSDLDATLTLKRKDDAAKRKTQEPSDGQAA